MATNIIEVFTKKGTQFSILFIVAFMGLYMAFQTPTMTSINQKAFKTSFDFFLTTTLSKVKIWTEAKNPKDPFLFTVNFYSKREFEQKKKEAIAARKKTVDISTKQNDFNGRHMTNLYLPFLLALFIATPFSWLSKLPALLVGVGLYWITLMYIFVTKIALVIPKRGIGEYQFEGFQKDLLEGIAKIANVGFFSVLVIFIWFVTIVMFNKQKDFFRKKETTKNKNL